MDNLIQEVKKENALFNRASDVFVYKVWQVIEAGDRYSCFYIKDFAHLKQSPRKVQRALDILTKQNYIKKIKSYPVYWEKIKEGEWCTDL